PWQTENLVSIEEYEETLDELVRTTRPTVSDLILMTPYYIEPDCVEPMRARMDQYGAVIKRLALKYETTFVDTQAAFNAVLPHVHPGALAGDRVHPNLTGHHIIARAFLKAIGAL